ncbi:beta-galactosidase [Undibacterium sp. GrIS 1.8]|uniref:beta-galactosidase n=1 Tax=Undibacterium sp. GrIS 1.8 TaxID=3143934 RepID=UPI003397FB64
MQKKLLQQERNCLHPLKVRLLLSVICSLTAGSQALSQTLLQVDASAPLVAPVSGHLRMGTALSPAGKTLGINNQYLLKDGQPWLPVMGEFHYSRSPADSWEAELSKMKSAGINIVSSYVIWNHHEEQEGIFNWKGNRDLHHFLELCRKVGLKAVVRVGPWAHAEARFGGIPDWVVNTMPTRGNDPQYLHFVERLYRQIGVQLKGQLWKQGGSVIAIQLENEYNLTGAGEGAAHISTLKKLALQAGLDVPLYTVTGWDGTVYPSGEVTPVFGGYPDEPWGVSTSELPPKETYAFRFDSRVSGDLGAQTAASAPGTAETDKELTPFLGAEYGAGLPAMYRRRTLVSADDIASMLPVQLGSGVNLMGYYMFHGGRNPSGLSVQNSLEESTLTGGYNDTPMISYDFNAPLGPDGQQRPVLSALRPFHYFLNNFGDRLAPMTVRKPELVSASAIDLNTPRFSVRSAGDSAFLFFNNHVRQYPMPTQRGVQFSVKLSHQTVVFPQHPVDIADGNYFIWPINFDLDGTRLIYATAQPVARLDNGKAGLLYVFAEQKDIPVEFAFDPAVASYLTTSASEVHQKTSDGKLIIDGIKAGTSSPFSLQQPNARPITVLVLKPEQLKQLSIGDFAGQRHLVLSGQEPYFASKGLYLRTQEIAPVTVDFRFAVYPPLDRSPHSSIPLIASAKDGIFQVFEAKLKARKLDVKVTELRAAQQMPPVIIGGLAKAAMQPIPENFRYAATWQIAIPQEQLRDAGEAILELDFVGDIGRLFSGTKMLDDWYYNGQHWQYKIKPTDTALTLSVLPLLANAPIYLPKEHRPDFKGASQVANLRQLRVLPVYHLDIQP